MENLFVLCLMDDDNQIVKPLRVFTDMKHANYYIKRHGLISRSRIFRVRFGPEESLDIDPPENHHF